VCSSDLQQISLAIASQYYRAGSYQEALNWAQRYQKLGGQDASARSLVYQSQYQSGNFEAAAKALSTELALAEKAGQKPAENLYQLLANCELKRGNQAGYQQALERLLAAYPKRDYWLSALQGVGIEEFWAKVLRFKQSLHFKHKATDL
jgi:tetratricopeptide (TPR) repeat protein